MSIRESQNVIYFVTYMSCVYLNRILPSIRYGQTTFTILKTYKLSMPDISPFSIKYDYSVTNNTFPIEILREKNHKKNAPICYTCTQFISEVKLLKKTANIRHRFRLDLHIDLFISSYIRLLRLSIEL